MDAQFRPIEERRAEMAAARAGRHVPATSSSDNRCWVCGRCGRAFRKKGAAYTVDTPGYVPYWDKPCPHCGEKQP